MKLKEYIPPAYRIRYQLTKRYIRNHFIKRYRYARQRTTSPIGSPQLHIKQAIKKSHLYENKLHNLRLGGAKIAALVIPPQRVFSFWKVIGAPLPKNGYKKGRNLVNGVLQEGYGGGLCQLSGLIYYLALRGGLTILERHNHSVDIYTEETRFAPLGTDATVVYGYKDLQIKNNTEGNIQFVIDVETEEITGSLHSESSIRPQDISFQITQKGAHKEVIGFNAQGERVNASVYA